MASAPSLARSNMATPFFGFQIRKESGCIYQINAVYEIHRNVKLQQLITRVHQIERILAAFPQTALRLIEVKKILRLSNDRCDDLSILSTDFGHSVWRLCA
jgi:hypothetical protein